MRRSAAIEHWTMQPLVCTWQSRQHLRSFTFEMRAHQRKKNTTAFVVPLGRENQFAMPRNLFISQRHLKENNKHGGFSPCRTPPAVENFRWLRGVTGSGISKGGPVSLI